MTQQFKNPNFWEDEEKKVAKNLLNSGFSVDLASNITNEKSNLSTLCLYTNWISDTGEMVIAKAITADGTVINIDKNNLELLDEYRVVLHPELQKYNLDLKLSTYQSPADGGWYLTTSTASEHEEV